MYRLAPLVRFYFGTDLSAVIIEKKQKNNPAGVIQYPAGLSPGHEIRRLEEKDFDLVIINSVIQSFHGHNYLRSVIRQVVDLMASQGFYHRDVMDQGGRCSYPLHDGIKQAHHNKNSHQDRLVRRTLSFPRLFAI